jgi:hypothetical protein
MASKKSKNKNQYKPSETNPTARSARMMQVIFLVISAIVVLSMILAATASF